MSRTTFTEYLRERRKELGLKQTDVADAMGYTQQYIVRWESGQVRHITEEHLRKWARVLETPVPHLRRLLGSDAPTLNGSEGRGRTVRELLRIPNTADGPERRLILLFAEALLENQGPALLSIFREWEREIAAEVGEEASGTPAAS